MLYIKRPKAGKINTPWFLSIVLPSAIVFIALLITLLATWRSSLELVESRRAEIVARQTDRANANLNARIDAYEHVLRVTGGVIGIENASTSQESWSEFVRALNITNRHDGLLGVGYAHIVSEENRDSHEQQIQAEGIAPDYEIASVDDEDNYAAVIRISPITDEQNASLLGFNLYADEGVRSLLEASRDSAEVALIYLPTKEDIDDDFIGTGRDTLLALPIYDTVEPPESLRERRASIIGYSFVLLNNNDFFSDLFEEEDSYAYTVTIGDQSNGAILYQTPDTNNNNVSSTATAGIRTTIAGKNISVVATNTQRVLTAQEYNRPERTLVAGIVFLFVVTGFVYLLTAMRAQNIRERERASVDQAKDELLALASHQLRTPATGVKQYLGMLREGYTGKLTRSQSTLIEQAYESNERQLNIVNELLFLARLDSGKVRLQHKKLELVKFVRKITRDVASHKEYENKNLELRLPKKEVAMQADHEYIGMALENVIENAFKYTPEDGSVLIRVTMTNKQMVQIDVKDDGEGIHEKDIPRVFQKFTRVNNSNTNNVGGSGIGLYLTKKIIEAHEGEIIVKSKLNVGTVVSIVLPLKQRTNTDQTLDISQ